MSSSVKSPSLILFPSRNFEGKKYELDSRVLSYQVSFITSFFYGKTHKTLLRQKKNIIIILQKTETKFVPTENLKAMKI